MESVSFKDRVAVVIITRDGAGRLARCLDSLLAIFPSIYVFVDSRTMDDSAAVASSRGARVALIENTGFFEDVYARAVEHVPAQWILRLDDDETIVPNNGRDDQRALLCETLDRAEAQGINSFFLPRRWLLPGMTHFISSMCWWPNPSRRLFRKVDGIGWPTRIHDEMAVPGSAALLPSFFIDHYDFVYNDRAARERKVERYRQERPEFSGEHTYLYENYSFTASPLKPLPEPDVLSAMRGHFDFFGRIERGEGAGAEESFELLHWQYAPLLVRRRAP